MSALLQMLHSPLIGPALTLKHFEHGNLFYIKRIAFDFVQANGFCQALLFSVFHA